MKKQRGTHKPGRSQKGKNPVPAVEYLTKPPLCPRDLMAEARPYWRESAKVLVRNRMLVESDLLMFRKLCEAAGWYERFSTAAEGQLLVMGKPNPLLVQARLWHGEMVKLSERFGLTPGARVRVAPPAPAETETDPWDDV